MSDVAIVTGANRGIGLETCRQLAEHGMRVVLTSRGQAQAEEAAASLRLKGLHVSALALDVTDATSIHRFAETVASTFGQVGALVNNAGVSLDGFDAEVVQRTVAANTYGPVHVSDALVPLMVPGGRIVMVSSGMGELSCLGESLRRRFLQPDLGRDGLKALIDEFIAAVEAGTYQRQGWPASAYRVSKVALNAFTRILAAELEGARILVNAVCPGWVRTSMGGSSAPRSVAQGADSIVWAATLGADGPTGQFFRDRRPLKW